PRGALGSEASPQPRLAGAAGATGAPGRSRTGLTRPAVRALAGLPSVPGTPARAGVRPGTPLPACHHGSILRVEPGERQISRVPRRVTECFLDTQQFVVLGHALTTGGRAALDLADTGCHRQISDHGVFGFTGAVTEH